MFLILSQKTHFGGSEVPVLGGCAVANKAKLCNLIPTSSWRLLLRLSLLNMLDESTVGLTGFLVLVSVFIASYRQADPLVSSHPTHLQLPVTNQVVP